MLDARWIPPPTKDYKAARSQFIELFGSLAVTNTYLKIAVLALCVVCICLAGLNVKTLLMAHAMKPLIIRINEVGRAEAVNYTVADYRPHEAELRYFLVQFVQQYYGRMRATVKENYTRSLYFLDGRLADSLIEANGRKKMIEAFLAGSSDEIDIRVNNVSIEDLRTPPYKATVDFEKIYYGAGDRSELRRERYVAQVVFVLREHVPNAMVPINPLGFTITYLREDQAFQ